MASSQQKNRLPEDFALRRLEQIKQDAAKKIGDVEDAIRWGLPLLTALRETYVDDKQLTRVLFQVGDFLMDYSYTVESDEEKPVENVERPCTEDD